MHYKLNGQNVLLEKAKETLGNEFFIELKTIEKSTMLDHSIFGFFDQCQALNYVLCKYGVFFEILREEK